MNKVILFDLDGVLTLPEEAFSVIYTKSHGYDIEPFTHFFENEWVEFVTGKKDLKEHITNNPDLWKWDGTSDELLNFWFQAEDVKNDSLLEVIRLAREAGFKCYIATEQEKYRTKYVKEVMFKNEFDGVFSTAEIGYKKNDRKFYEEITNTLNISPANIMFFDDSQSKIDVALERGLDARLYTGIEQVRESIFNTAQ
jgi:putative hydrolase of the HAD superfamily